MAPEKKAKGKGGGKKKAATGTTKKKKSAKASARKAVLLDGAPITDLSREQLLSRLERMIVELEREREERLYFQAERDRLCEIWEATKQACRETEATVKCLEKDLESGKAGYREQLAVQRQRQAWTLHQHQITLTEFQVKSHNDLQDVRQEAKAREVELAQQIEHLKREKRELTVSFESEATEMRRVQADEVLRFQNKCDRVVRDVETSWRQKFQKFVMEMRDNFEKEVESVQQARTRHEDDLKCQHLDTISEMTKYNKELVDSHLALVTSLKEENKKSWGELSRCVNEAATLKCKVSSLQEKLNKTDEAQKMARKYKEGFTSSISSLEKCRSQIRKMKDSVENLQFENEGLQQKLEKSEAEKSKLKEQLLRSVLELQQKQTVRTTLQMMAKGKKSSSISSGESTEDSSY